MTTDNNAPRRPTQEVREITTAEQLANALAEGVVVTNRWDRGHVEVQLDPGWLSRQVERAQDESRRREEIQETLRLLQQSPSWPHSAYDAFRPSSNSFSGSFVYMDTGGPISPPTPPDNRCMDTVARAVVEEPRRLGLMPVEEIPLGEYGGKTNSGSNVSFVVRCHTVVNSDRLIYVNYRDNPTCIGTINRDAQYYLLRHRYGTFHLRDIHIISQQSIVQTPASHIRRVEL